MTETPEYRKELERRWSEPERPLAWVRRWPMPPPFAPHPVVTVIISARRGSWAS